MQTQGAPGRCSLNAFHFVFVVKNSFALKIGCFAFLNELRVWATTLFASNESVDILVNNPLQVLLCVLTPDC